MAWKKFSSKMRMAGDPTPRINRNVMPAVVGTGVKCNKLYGNACASKLVFIPEDEAAKYNTKPGPNILYCAGEGQPGAAVPVKDVTDVTKLSRRFCACIKSKGKTKSCIESLAKKPLLKARRTRRK